MPTSPQLVRCPGHSPIPNPGYAHAALPKRQTNLHVPRQRTGYTPPCDPWSRNHVAYCPSCIALFARPRALTISGNLLQLSPINKEGGSIFGLYWCQPLIPMGTQWTCGPGEATVQVDVIQRVIGGQVIDIVRVVFLYRLPAQPPARARAVGAVFIQN